jgi:hypothetical protein
METYEVEYEGFPLASVEVDSERSESVIKEMVDFWSGSEERLESNGGDYLRAWLKQLGMFILRNHRPPKDDEGWCPLDGTHGITLKDWTSWEPDEDAITIFT